MTGGGKGQELAKLGQVHTSVVVQEDVGRASLPAPAIEPKEVDQMHLSVCVQLDRGTQDVGRQDVDAATLNVVEGGTLDVTSTKKAVSRPLPSSAQAAILEEPEQHHTDQQPEQHNTDQQPEQHHTDPQPEQHNTDQQPEQHHTDPQPEQHHTDPQPEQHHTVIAS